MTYVDPDDASTWSGDVRGVVERLAEIDDSDMSFPFADNDPELREALGQEHVLAYHLTRLLPEEIDSVRRDGLALLSEELVDRKLDAAVRAGAITTDVRAKLRAGSMGDEVNRRGQVCMAVGRDAFTNNLGGVRPLLRQWGGEAINFTAAAKDVDELFKTGVPAIVLVAVPFHAVQQSHVWPSMTAVFVGAWRGRPRGADLIWRDGPIAASEVLDVRSPGDPWYDQFPGLPKT